MFEEAYKNWSLLLAILLLWISIGWFATPLLIESTVKTLEEEREEEEFFELEEEEKEEVRLNYERVFLVSVIGGILCAICSGLCLFHAVVKTYKLREAYP